MATVDLMDFLLAMTGTTLLVALIGFIWYAYYRAWSDSTVSLSEIIARWGQRVRFLWFIVTAIVSFTLGLLCGHWFWPVHL